MFKIRKPETRLLFVEFIFIAGLVIFIFLWWIFNTNQKKLFLKASQINDIKITSQVLYFNEEKYTGPLIDNSEWDETVQYVANPTRDFEEECINTLLETFSINAIWVYDPDWNLVYTVNDSSEKALFTLLSPDSIKNSLSRQNPKCHFFLTKDSLIFEVFGATIVPTIDIRHLSSPSGFYFYAITWDTALIRGFEKITGMSIDLSISTSGDQEVIEYLPNHVHRDLSDWNGRPIASITFVNHDPVLMEWEKTMRILVLFSVCIGLVFILLLGYLFRKWVTTPLKFTIKELHASEERFKQVAESAEEWIWEVDADGLYTYSNSVVEKILGYKPDEIVGKKYFYNLFKSEVAEDLKSGALAAFSQKTSFKDFINPNLHKNGQTVILETTGSPILDKEGNLTGYRGTDMNITERLKNEKELIKAKEKAEESDRLKTAFLSNMSHEIRTPMNGILGFAELLNDDELTPDDRHKYVSIINKNSRLLLRVISDIVDIAKIESNQLSIHRVVFNLNALLDNIFTMFHNELILSGKDHVNLLIEKEFENDKSYILCDDARLEQILNNLIGNATKFTQSGYIKFGYRTESGNLIFFVEDTGKGVAKNKQHIIFDRFRQEEEDHTRKYGGSGLGLPISRGLVELLGGKMWMASGESAGSSFFFRLPLSIVLKAPPKSQGPVQDHEKPYLKNKIILIVDDSAENFELIRMILKGTEAEILYTDNGRDAIEICQTNTKINLIFMDIQMPVMNGYETTMEIRKFRPLLPVVALTAYAFPEDKIRVLNAGCNDILTKPILKEKLISIIKKILC